MLINNCFSGDANNAAAEGDATAGSDNSEKKLGYETNLYLYNVSKII